MLRECVIRHGNHYALGKQAGVAAAVVSRFARGERGISLETASRLAHALGLVLEEREHGRS